MVECPVCDVEFDIAKRGPVCPNGHPHPDGETTDGNSGSNSETTDGNKVSDPDLTSGDDSFACSSCGSTAVEEDDAFCPNCGSELNEDVGGEPKKEVDTCPNCGQSDIADAAFCPNCGTDLDNNAEDSAPDRVILESDGGEVTAEDGEAVGAALRNAAVNGGVSKDKARKIHREHVKFDIEDDGVAMEVLGVNPTLHENNELSQGDRVDIKEGDTVEFSRTLEATVKFE